jgi:DNA-binding MarR family transcriptional regulator
MTTKRLITRNILDIVKSIDFSPTEENLSPLQIDTLLYIQRKGCVKGTEIAKEFKVTPATITIQIDRLAKNGWVERCFDTKDKRATNITVTKKTENELENIIEEIMHRYDWIFEALTLKEQKNLLKMLEKVKNNTPKN